VYEENMGASRNVTDYKNKKKKIKY